VKESTSQRLAVITLVLLVWTAPSRAEGLWVKGNTHTHTNLSDGDAPADDVVSWYKGHGYGFVVLSDHNKIVPLSFFDAHTDSTFVTIAGEEISNEQMKDVYGIHINAIGITRPLRPVGSGDTLPTLKANVEMILGACPVIQFNHPSLYFLHSGALSILPDSFLVETYNHSSRTDPKGPLQQVYFEQAWDAALSMGKRAYGVASDDTHEYRDFGPRHANPGGGWVMVHVANLTREEILKNLVAGNFYSSTGVEIAGQSVEIGTIRISVKPVEGVTYTIRFIGKAGRTLRQCTGTTAEYRPTGRPQEAYVRVRVNASNGTAAWTQPVWPEKKP
jgi:hypothetical protein